MSKGDEKPSKKTRSEFFISSEPNKSQNEHFLQAKIDTQTGNRVVQCVMDEERCKIVGNHICMLWLEQKMCDVVFKCCDGIVKAHKVVLSAYSERVLENFKKFSDQEIINVDLHEYNVNAVILFLNILYVDGDRQIEDEYIAPLLELSQLLDMPPVREACKKFLRCNHPENAIFHYVLADHYNMFEIRDPIYNYILQNFLEVCETKHFLWLHPERLMLLLSDDRLHVSSELDVFCAMAYWIDYNRKERMPLAPKMLRNCVRLMHISPECLVCKVEKVSWLFDNPECWAILNEAIRCHALYKNNEELANTPMPQLHCDNCPHTICN